MLSVIIILILLLIAYQDIRLRSVSVVLFVLVGVLNFARGVSRVETQTLITYISVNTAFVVIIMSLLTGYLLIRYKKNVKVIFRDFLGIGDLVFWVMMVPAFSPANYVLFYFFSMLTCAILFPAIKKISQPQDVATVPLAGMQALFYVGLLVGPAVGFEFNSYKDFQF